MKTIVGSVLASALLLSASITLYALHGADDGVPPATAAHHLTAAAAGPEGPPSQVAMDARIDPQRARSWIAVGWHDGRRTAQRLQSLPELTLLPDHGAALLTAIAGLREAALTVSLDDLAPRPLVIEGYRVRQAMAGLTPAERVARNAAFSKDAMDQAKAANQAGTPFMGSALLHGRLIGDAADAAVITWVRDFLAQAVSRNPGQGLSAVLAGPDRPRCAITGTTMDLDSPDASDRVSPLVPSASATHADADLDCTYSLNPGNGAFMPSGGMQITVTADGLHLTMDQPAYDDDASVAAPTPLVDRARLATLPADTVLAVQAALSPGSTAESVQWSNILTSVRMGMDMAPPSPALARQEAVVDGIITAIKRIDGQVQLYMEPGSPLPVVTVVADLPRAAWSDLRTVIGAPVADDGSVTVELGTLQLSLGWQEGHLLVTTNPAGLPGSSTSGAFTSQPEIRKAMAAMPPGDAQILALIRPEAFTACVGPFAGLLVPQTAQQLPAYQQALHAQTAYGYLVVIPGQGSVHVEASGLLTFAAAAVLGTKIASPTGVN